ncbi:hypothetical protein FNV43_RR15046 [Rhamnella rubrinervis]|uniref:NAC domain-containing protein n=1 Tax=Rhamnella rubrinervis TaxID=2594499 RepID=A0A8K0E882_9ROSA|nr:hypothetical protein FNV43_RR15046 [Rhamnella rubrinervis]
MSNISMVEAKLPPGFRFHPRDEELVCDYLLKKVTHSDSTLMIEVDLNKCEPWDIPETACVGGKEWYFYSQRDRKYATGLRTNRATASGYWKATGKDRPVLSKGRSSGLVGMRKTLVFYQGRAPKGKKTEWVMHEFRLEGPSAPPKLSSSPKEDWVLCRVFYKSREVVGARPSLGISCFGDTNGSKSLPPLMDSNYISFDYQAAQNYANDQYEQVPCFSNIIYPQNQSSSNINPIPKHRHQPHMEEYYNSNLTTKVEPTLSSSTTGIIMPNNEPYSCDNEVLKAVLSHFTKMESNNQSLKGSPSLGEGTPSESYLSEVGMPNIWSHY